MELEVWSLRADKHRIKVLVEFGRGRVVGVCCSGGGLANEKIDFFCNRYYTYFTYPLSIGFDTVARSKTIWPKIQQEHEKKQKKGRNQRNYFEILESYSMLYVRCLLFFQNYYLSSVDLHRILSNLGAVNNGRSKWSRFRKEDGKRRELTVTGVGGGCDWVSWWRRERWTG